MKSTGTLVLLCMAAIVAGCASTPGGSGELSATGKVALQEVTRIALRRSITGSPRAQQKLENIREIAGRLRDAAELTTVAALRLAVDHEVAKLGLAPIDAQDAASLLNIFQALLEERVGKDELDSAALVRVNDFVAMILAALPETRAALEP